MRAGHQLSEITYAIADLMYFPRNTEEAPTRNHWNPLKLFPDTTNQATVGPYHTLELPPGLHNPPPPLISIMQFLESIIQMTLCSLYA